MYIVDIEGPDLDRLRHLFRDLEDQFASDLVWKVAVAVDDIDRAFKVKVNESVWSPPIGTALPPQTFAEHTAEALALIHDHVGDDES